MDVTVDRTALAGAVGWAARALPTGTVATQIPTLTGLLLDHADEGRLSVAAYDYELSARAAIPTLRDHAAGRVLAPGRLLATIVKQLPGDDEVRLATDGTGLIVTCGPSRFVLRTLPVDDYPKLPIPPFPVGQVDGPTLAAAVAQVAVAAGREAATPALTGLRVEWDADGRLTLAATDRYRLAVRSIPWQLAAVGASGAALLPAATLADVARALATAPTVVVGIGDGPAGARASFTAAELELTCRLVTGQFPPYRKLLAGPVDLAARVDRARLADAVKRVALAAPRTAPVFCTFGDGALVLEAGSSGGGVEAFEALPADLPPGAHVDTAYNPAYLADGLAADTGPVTFGFLPPDDARPAGVKPAILTGGGDSDYRYLLMPIQKPDQ